MNRRLFTGLVALLIAGCGGVKNPVPQISITATPFKDTTEYTAEIDQKKDTESSRYDSLDLDLPLTDLFVFDTILSEDVMPDLQSPDLPSKMDVFSQDTNPINDIIVKTPLKPYLADQNCVALFHLNNPNYFKNECATTTLIDLNTSSILSSEGFADARYCNGTSYLELPYYSELDIKKDFTIEALVKPSIPGKSYNGDFGNIVTKLSGDATSKEGYALFLFGNNRAGVSLGIGDEWLQATADTPLSTEFYSHVVGTYDGKDLKLYVNGTLAGINSKEHEILYLVQQPLRFCFNFNNGFIGNIDEVRISNIVREQDK